MGFVSEFKKFAVKGNVMDMAVGIIIGGAFGKIVASFVADVIMPPIGLLLGGVDFTKLKIVMQEAVMNAEGAVVTEEVAIRWGSFVQTAFDFLIIALVIFMMIKGMNNLKKKEEEAPAAPPEPSNEEKLLTEIRDALKSNN